MNDKVLDFYEALAEQYHLIFDDWDRAIDRQARVLGPLMASRCGQHPLKILDVCCGIGTQSIGFARMGHTVVASDLSPAQIDRARREAESRSLEIAFQVADMTSLTGIEDSGFDVVGALDNALPHLDAAQLEQALRVIASKLKPGGLFMASIRDYGKLKDDKPAMQPPAFFGEAETRRIVHQVWDWMDDLRYTVHLYLTIHSVQGWSTSHFTSEYRCLLFDELSTLLAAAGFRDIEWLTPAESGFYQPIVLARSPGRPGLG